MLLEPSSTVGIVANVVWIGGWSAGIGCLANRRSSDSFAADRWWGRLLTWETDGRWYERRLRIRAWKDRLPEAGSAFAGGVSKRRLRRRTDVDRLEIETRRAEWTHWVVMAGLPVTFAWNPPAGCVAIAAFGLVANLPFIAIQRYNRARIGRLRRRRRL